MAQHITVRVGKLPGKIAEYALNGDRTVATALATAGLDATGYEVRVQGAPTSMTATLADGDLVLLVRKIKGNGEGFYTALVGRVPGPALALVAFAIATVEAALEAAGIVLADGEAVYVNDALASLTSPVRDDDRIVVKATPMAQPEPEPEIESSFDDELEELAERAAGLRSQAEAYLAQANRIQTALAKYREAVDELDELV